jgi:HEAT repeat protein
MAAEALVGFPAPSVVDALVKGLNARSAEVRLFSAFALGEMGARKALSHLDIVARTDAGNVQGYGSVSRQAMTSAARIRRLSPIE